MEPKFCIFFLITCKSDGEFWLGQLMGNKHRESEGCSYEQAVAGDCGQAIMDILMNLCEPQFENH